MKAAAPKRPSPTRLSTEATPKSTKSGAPRTKLAIVTGVSGSGRGTAIRVLEDLGFYCVDNIPVALAPSVVKLATEHDPALKGIALGIDQREKLFFPDWPKVFDQLEREGFPPQILFLDASDEVLARRYSETRRPHPMASGGASVADSIRRERMELAEMRERASRVIDTTTLTVHELREVVTAAVMGSVDGRMTIAVVSFGYKYGMPVGLDLVVDTRFIPNPFFVPELRLFDGLDPRVRDYINAQPQAQRFVEELMKLLDFLLPLYQREGKSYLTIGLGCTGGRHRSPMLAREIRERLAGRGYAVELRHHDIAR